MLRVFKIVILAALLLSAMSYVAAASPSSEAARLEKQLATLRDEFKAAGRAYDSAYWELDKTDARISEIDTQMGVTQTELADARSLLEQRLARMYRSDSVDYLSVLLGATTFQEMVTRLDFVQRIGQADADAIQSVEALQVQLRNERALLEKERENRSVAVRELEKRRDSLQAQFRSKQAEYDKAKAALDAARKASSPSGSIAAPNASGLVFPVRGACYYSDTWGAARSGGRSHKGTDIMAPRGTTCVAVTSGSVTAKNSGLGGKTIWLRGDNGTSYYYAHLDSWAVTSGRVGAGQVIGYVGSTGNASASSPHLHFEIHPGGGGAVNPYPYLRRME